SALALRERTHVLVAFGTGMWMSELFALKWRDVKFQTNEVSIVRSIVVSGNQSMQNGSFPETNPTRSAVGRRSPNYGVSKHDSNARIIGHSQVLLRAANILIGASASCDLSSGPLR